MAKILIGATVEELAEEIDEKGDLHAIRRSLCPGKHVVAAV
jgi:hypothetical protein